MKRILTITVMMTALIMTGACGSSDEQEKTKEKQIPVRIQLVEQKDMPVVVEAIGRLEPRREVTLSAEIAGIVNEYTVDVGDRVETDGLVVRLKPMDYQLQLDEARANLASALARLDTVSKSFERSKKLLPRKVITPDAFEKSEAEYRGARAAVTQARALVSITAERLRKTQIRSPFSGWVARRMVELGQTLAPGTAVMNIVDFSMMRVRIHLSEHDYVHLDREDPVTVTIEALPEKTYTGRIDRIGIKADPMTNTFDVEVLVDNPDLTLKAGLAARVNLTSHVIKDAVMIPQSSVLYREKIKEVFIVGPDLIAESREIKIGQVKGSLIRVLEGLQSGDQLVVTGGQYLKSGDKVILSNN